MMGQQAGAQDELFYCFNLDAHVPADHLLRGIDRFLDLGELRRHLAAFYSHTGRPSIDPELMMRMLIIGYCFGIRSERRLCDEVHLNVAYRWFCRLGLQDPVPEHSTFSKNRHGRFRDSDAFRHLFETVLQRCIAEGLVGGEGFAIDASVVKADASRDRSVSGAEWPQRRLDGAEATRAVREYLAGIDEEASRRLEADRKSISLTDPAAEWTCAPGGPAFFGYSTNYLVDVQAGVIVDVEATSAHRNREVDATRTMIERVEQRFALKPAHLIGDMAYGPARCWAGWCRTSSIAPHIPVWDKSERSDGTSVVRLHLRCPAQPLRCPAGKLADQLRAARTAKNVRYRASQLRLPPLLPEAACCPNMLSRKITRSPLEPARDVARALANTEAYRQSRKDRKKVEMLFAHLKRILRLDRLRLRGPKGASDEFLLAATVQNLRRMAKRWLRSPPIAVPIAV